MSLSTLGTGIHAPAPTPASAAEKQKMSPNLKLLLMKSTQILPQGTASQDLSVEISLGCVSTSSDAFSTSLIVWGIA